MLTEPTISWVALDLTVSNGDTIGRGQLRARLAKALQIDDATAEAAITDLVDEGLLRMVTESVVAISHAGRDRHAA